MKSIQVGHHVVQWQHRKDRSDELVRAQIFKCQPPPYKTDDPLKCLILNSHIFKLQTSKSHFKMQYNYLLVFLHLKNVVLVNILFINTSAEIYVEGTCILYKYEQNIYRHFWLNLMICSVKV